MNQPMCIWQIKLEVNTSRYSFKKKDMAVTIQTKCSVDIGDPTVQIDPQLLFLRLIVFLQHDDIKEAFQYELCTRPTSLFDSTALMNKADKPELMHCLADLPGQSECLILDLPSSSTHSVIDGGSLLQRIPCWILGKAMVKFVKHMYAIY